MKALIINGSPNPSGNTASALHIVDDALRQYDVETRWFQLGKEVVRGCIQCGYCKKEKRCVFNDDDCNAIIEKVLESDAVLIGSPVYFSGANGALCAILDRVFYAACTWHQLFAGKTGSALVTQYRSGGSSALDRLHKYFFASQMIIASSDDYLVFPEIGKLCISHNDRQFLVNLARNIVMTRKNAQNNFSGDA